jgi:hypothetical protein
VSSNPKNIRPPAGHEPLDAIDERLLAALVDDARISNKQLAELVGIAPSTALMRTRALSDRGIIQGFEAKLSLSAIGRSVQALIAVPAPRPRPGADRPVHLRVPKLPPYCQPSTRPARSTICCTSPSPPPRTFGTGFWTTLPPTPSWATPKPHWCSTTCRATTAPCRNGTDQAPELTRHRDDRPGAT